MLYLAKILLNGYSEKIVIHISETEEINNIISNIISKRGIKTIDMLKDDALEALTERGYTTEIINEYIEYIE